MKIKCSFPECTHTKNVGILTWLLYTMLIGDPWWYLCEEHRFTEEEWDDLHDELKRTGKLS